MRRRLEHSAGFSLIELLVVVGVLAVLISILLPVLAAARQRSQSLTCLSNLRELATAFRLYAQDHGDRLPGPTEPWDDLLVPYLPGGRSFICPADADGMAKSMGLSYAWRDDVATMDPYASLSGASLSSVKGASDLVLVFDISPNWHGQGILNAASIDTHARAYTQQELLENLHRHVRD